MVGASLALALGRTELRVALIEAFAADAEAQPAYDERTVALTWSARQIFSGLGVWEAISARGAEPILDIHVSNRGHFGATHLAASDAGTEALGYVVPTRVIGSVLSDQLLRLPNLQRFQPARATGLSTADHQADVTLEGEDVPGEISTRLAVIADGGRSEIAKEFSPDVSPYSQQALLCIVTTDRPHGGRAFERFTREGPIALLPHSDRRYAVVWTGEEATVAARMEMDDATFIAALQEAFGDRAGNLSRPAPRKSYPLQRTHLDRPVGNRTVVVGNAAHTVHPVAGQGFNLGLRDVAWLAQLIDEAASRGDDVGAGALLNEYADLRSREAKRVSQFTHGLIRAFSNEIPGLGFARNTALTVIEHLPAAKRLLLRRTMGLHGQGSALARGAVDRG